MNHRISIVTVNYNSYDWCILLRESINHFASEAVEIIIIDNSDKPVWEHTPFEFSHKLDHIHIGKNIGHGEGLNLGADIAETPYTMFLDIDCHFLQKGWENAFVDRMDQHDVVAGRGVPQKPIRPACMFMKTEFAKKYDWRATPGYKGHRINPEGFDVAIKAYWAMINDGVKIDLIDSVSSKYDTLSGEEWCVENIPYVYHHWHGTHIKERQIDFPNNDLMENKALLFQRIPWRSPNNSL